VLPQLTESWLARETSRGLAFLLQDLPCLVLLEKGCETVREMHDW